MKKLINSSILFISCLFCVSCITVNGRSILNPNFFKSKEDVETLTKREEIRLAEIAKNQNPNLIKPGFYVMKGSYGGAELSKTSQPGKYYINIDIGDGIHGTNFDADCYQQGRTLICPALGISYETAYNNSDSDEEVLSEVRIEQTSNNKILISMETPVYRLNCGASYCFDGEYTRKK